MGRRGGLRGGVVDSDDGGDYEETLMRKDVCLRHGVCRVFQIVYTEVDNRYHTGSNDKTRNEMLVYL